MSEKIQKGEILCFKVQQKQKQTKTKTRSAIKREGKKKIKNNKNKKQANTILEGFFKGITATLTADFSENFVAEHFHLQHLSALHLLSEMLSYFQ